MEQDSQLKQSYQLLMQHKIIILPILLSIILPIIVLLFFLVFSTYNTAIEQFVNEQLVTADVTSAFMYFISMLAAILFVNFYFTCMTYALITMAVKKLPFTLATTFSKTHHYFLRFLYLRFLVMAILVTPLVILGILGFLLYNFTILLGIIGLIFLPFILIAYLAYVVYIYYIFFYDTTSLYIEDTSATSALKHSFAISKHHFRYIMVVFLIMVGFYFLMKSINQTFTLGSSLFLESSSMALMVVGVLLLILVVIIESIYSAFIHMYWFESYKNLEDGTHS
ncbi:MAG: hypothetical protein ACMXYC_03770 [Candidatus Woesearchaeota archaeon]